MQEEMDNLIKELIEKKVKSFENHRRAQRLTIEANIAYLCGHQHVQIVNGTLQPIPQTERDVVIANKILPAVINDIANATKIAPKLDVVPAGTDEDDAATAKAGQKILPYIQRINGEDLARGLAVLWYDLAGVGWRKVYWDPKAKLIGNNPGPNEEGFIPEMQPGEPIFQGEVVIEHVPNNELVYDHRKKNLKNLDWIIHHKVITLGELKQRFGADAVEGIDPAEIHTTDSGEDSFAITVFGDFAELSKSIAPSPKESESSLLEIDKLVDYYEFWHKPNQSLPQGSYAVVAGDKVFVNQPYPVQSYPHMELPFVPAAPVPLDGVITGSIPRISQARPLQREYNRVRSLILDGSDVMSNAVMFVQRGANVEYKKVTNQNGVIVEYDGMIRPQREQGIPLCASLFAHLETIRRDIDEIFAFHEASKGIMPKGGPRSGIGLQSLQEADGTQLSPIVRALDIADQVIANQALQLAIANYKERLIHIVGKDNQWCLEKINMAELTGKCNVVVRTGSSLPISKAMEQDRAFSAWQSGLLGMPNDPSVRRYVLKMMDLGGFDQLLQDNAKDVNFAQQEFIGSDKLIRQLPAEQLAGLDPKIAGQIMEQFVYVPPVNVFDDHLTHRMEHSNFLKDKYHEYIATNLPPYLILVRAMMDHIAMHDQAIMAQQMQSPEMISAMAQMNKSHADQQKAQTDADSPKSDKKE